jgi:type IV pilus assembly protein PilE
MVRKTEGFSLIELIVVMAIIGILASIAIPSYTSSIQKGRRADGKVALAGAVALQERQFSLTHQYSADISILGGATSTEGFYAMSVAYMATLGGCATDKDCYTLTATAVGAQANDTSCAVLTVNSLGQKTPSGDCW